MIYTTNTCPYCDQAKALLDRKKAQYEVIDVTNYTDLLKVTMEKGADGKASDSQVYAFVPMHCCITGAVLCRLGFYCGWRRGRRGVFVQGYGSGACCLLAVILIFILLLCV